MKILPVFKTNINFMFRIKVKYKLYKCVSMSSRSVVILYIIIYIFHFFLWLRNLTMLIEVIEGGGLGFNCPNFKNVFNYYRKRNEKVFCIGDFYLVIFLPPLLGNVFLAASIEYRSLKILKHPGLFFSESRHCIRTQTQYLFCSNLYY